MTTNLQMFQAIRDNDLAGLKQLIEADKGLLDARNERGTPPLTLATYLNNRAASEFLIEAGADLEAKDAAGTALMGVCFKGYVAMVTLLLDAGANVNATNDKGATALIFATMFNQVAVVDLLLKSGANTRLTDEHGMSAIDHARNRGINELVDRLSKV